MTTGKGMGKQPFPRIEWREAIASRYFLEVCRMAEFTNFATLSYRGGTLRSNTVTGEILETVSVEKTAVRGSYSDGDTLSYALGLANSGTMRQGSR